jgi:cell division protein FtsZ
VEPVQAVAEPAGEPPADEPSGPVSIPRPTPEPANPPTPITSRMQEPAKRPRVIFEEQEEELDVPDFLK